MQISLLFFTKIMHDGVCISDSNLECSALLHKGNKKDGWWRTQSSGGSNKSEESDTSAASSWWPPKWQEPTGEPTCVCVAGPHIQAYQSLGYIRGTLSERHL